ncbi:MAG: glucose-6-phosphate 1-dehydrogenase, glucose-6-phosphate 1-dehydrogenase [Candidatus Gottesmanbacteria bacterium GW2011_GWA2_43_14]|uniref:Glucose-6-phosphate 1-dehydrogenase n=1 Tax=Candidatus Gottesmanbacteria bacterium GW2011_GWA2_43_14 TaxID=1618443 RepID=A0A0G1DD40_9BACT|nr:MAG: glucose-6-phosphate 1-dehydrogenase, glucose-6-phosphate 1-dehydrogenase [Candidatus Gottesmanbacteria bacterium GW2011_GWA2_43_14]
MQNPISPFVMVIFGATGDLTARKLMPALYNLTDQVLLPDRFFIVGVARRSFSDVQFRSLMLEAVNRFSRNKIKDEVWKQLEKNLYYQQGLFEDKEPYNSLIPRLKSFDDELGACITRFFYLATPPQNYSQILSHLSETKLSEGCGQGSSKWTRVLIEKPFGKDLNEAKKLEEQLSRTFDEKQIYRIDHYLAKETIQNILTFRFANPIEWLWNKDYIDHVQITLAESGGVGNRGKFYEGVGALKDVGQNHLMAMLAYIAMEEPQTMTAADTRKMRVEVLEKIRCQDEKSLDLNVVCGQYGPGLVHGRQTVSYRQEKDVAADSLTETFVAFKLFIDNPRWDGVPFYLRTGKRLANDTTRIDIQLKNRESKLFQQFHLIQNAPGNVLTIRVQPKEGITLRLLAKVPGLVYEMKPVDMDFSYSTSFKKEIIDSYEKILVDSMVGDQTLFATANGFAATWEYITSILNGWGKQPPPKFPNYRAGSMGPAESIKLIERDGRRWMEH